MGGRPGAHIIAMHAIGIINAWTVTFLKLVNNFTVYFNKGSRIHAWHNGGMGSRPGAHINNG